jgi:hypothetical protein
MAITARNIIIKNQSLPQEEPRVEFNGITARNIIVKNQSLSEEARGALEPEIKIVQMEEGTVIHNGQPKKFNKKMSAYMIDMLTSEE